VTSTLCLRIATRFSPQARAQADHIANELGAAHPAIDVQWVFVDTVGDRRVDVPLHRIGGQGVFVKEVQRAVIDGRADIAVHSAKDLPSTFTPGLTIGAYGARRDARDVLVGTTLDELAVGATVATGSVRRKALLAERRPDLQFTELRGNIATRLSKVPANGAIVMAAAALDILGMPDRISDYLDPSWFIPQVGQGAVAIECRDDDADTLGVLAMIDNQASRFAVELERTFLAEIGSGCSLPVGAHVADGYLTAFSQAVDGVIRRGRALVEGVGDPLAVARQLAADVSR